MLVSVPATMIKSDCRGDALKTIPNLSMSYLLTAACIISTAQHAKPKVSGQSDPALAQPINDDILDDSHSNFIYFKIISSL